VITFDPTSKRIILDSTYATAAEIYSRWKEWVRIGDNAKYLPAFRAIGGDPLGGSLYISLYTFLLNGWRIRPMEANHTLVLEGNIAVDGGGDPVVPTLGSYKVLVQYTVPERAQAIATSGSGGASASEIAAAVRADLAPELAKLQEMVFTVPGKIDASVDSKFFRFNGTDWQSVI
jgi:hypothetical protein